MILKIKVCLYVSLLKLPFSFLIVLQLETVQEVSTRRQALFFIVCHLTGSMYFSVFLSKEKRLNDLDGFISYELIH